MKKSIGRMKIVLSLLLIGCVIVPSQTLTTSANRTGIKQSVVGSLQWIRQQVNNIKSGLRGGISVQELRSLKDYLVGFSPEETEEIDKEIDELLKLADQQFGPLDIRKSANGPLANKKENVVTVSSDVQQINAEQADSVCFRPPSPLSIRQTVVVQNLMKVENEEYTITAIYTRTATDTVIEIQSVTQTVTITAVAAPWFTTTTEYLTWTKFHTTETLLKDVAVKTSWVNLLQSEISVVYSHIPLTTTTPKYRTTTVTENLTSTRTVILNEVTASTMTVDQTQILELSVTNTMTKTISVEKVVTETEFTKVMVTLTSTINALETIYDCPKDVFFDAMKVWG